MRPSLRANTLWAVAGNVGYAASQCAVLVVLAKLTTAEAVGTFALALAVTAPVMLAASLQLRAVEATDARGEHGFAAYLGVRLVTTALALLFLGALASTGWYGAGVATLIVIVGLAKAFEAVSDVVFGLLQRHEALRTIAISMLAKGGLSVAALGLVLWLGGDLVVATLAMALAWGAWLWRYDLPAARRFALGRPSFAPRALADLAWLALPLGASAGLQSLMTNVPRYALEAHEGAAALGYFAALAYLVAAGNQPVMACWTALGPRLSQLYVTDRNGYRRLTSRALLAAVGMGIVTVAAAEIVGPRLLALLYAPDYAAHAGVLAWLAAVAAVGYVTSALACSITAARRFSAQLVVLVLTLTTSWLGSSVLVPRFGLLGAAWALLAAVVVQTACLAVVYRRAAAAPAEVA